MWHWTYTHNLFLNKKIKPKDMIVNTNGVQEYIPESSIYTVRELNNYLKIQVEQDEKLREIWVKGQTYNVRTYKENSYFTLVDGESSIKCIYKGQVEENKELAVKGTLNIYEKRGECQIKVSETHLVGLSKLHEEYLALKKKLGEQGFFENKKTIPKYPKKISVITAKDSAAEKDVLNTIKRRYPLAKITVKHATMQGKQSHIEVKKTLEEAESDVIIIARGGGSYEDLASFNNEELAKAIYYKETPIITGIGHETDFTIADFTANKRAATPTAAAELATPDIRNINKEIESHVERQKEIAKNKAEELKKEISREQEKLTIKVKQKLKEKKQEAELLEEKLEKYNYEKALERGQVLIIRKGKITKKGSELEQEDIIKILFKDKEVKAKVI